MFRASFVVAISLSILTTICSAQSEPTSATTCTLDDGRQVSLRFNAVTSKAEKPPNGKPWTPGGAAMTLFTEAPLAFGGTTIPIGAYTVYPIPAKDKWTLVVNKNVTRGAAYDEKQDMARATMETDQIPQPSDVLDVAFEHVGAKCTLRIYFGKALSSVPFVAK